MLIQPELKESSLEDMMLVGSPSWANCTLSLESTAGCVASGSHWCSAPCSVKLAVKLLSAANVALSRKSLAITPL